MEESSRGYTYDVFISFRGPDTRKILVGHLHQALERKALTAFIDTEELQKGQVLQVLFQAIEDSRLSVVIFSEHYASSTWCLREVTQIMRCKEEMKQMVVPVFYKVDPAHVRHQNEKFDEAFAKHEADRRESTDVIKRWRSALAEAANISGWNSQNYTDDAVLIQDIVNDIYEKLKIRGSSGTESNDLVGMERHIHQMKNLLNPGGLDDVRIVGIWGMGGLGKSTIARAVYDKFSHQFTARCCLEDVRRGFQTKGQGEMQQMILANILQEKVQNLGTSSVDSNTVIGMLSKKKLFLVLDDVDRLSQIQAFLGTNPLSSFKPGSRIIITSRDKQVLRHLLGESMIYHPKFLEYDKALELFNKYAKPSKEYSHLSSRAIEYAKGLPLAIKILGTSLYGKRKKEWEAELEKIREFQDEELGGVLRTSFQGLDESQKKIFLDVACFFRGIKKEYATKILDACGLHPTSGFRYLADRALLTTPGYYSSSQVLEMHDSLQDMALGIVRQGPKLTRLTIFDDIMKVSTQQEMDAVESIDIDLYNSKKLSINLKFLERMTNLKLMRIHFKRSMESVDDYNPSSEELYHQSTMCKHMVRGTLKQLSDELRCLIWHGCPLQYLPSEFDPLHLVDLDMRCSNIKRLWEGTQLLEKLKYINLSRSPNFEETPDITEATNLEKVNFECCTSLSKLHPSLFDRESLVFLSLKGCTELENLPSNMNMKSLNVLELSGCSKLKNFPEISEVMENLPHLFLDDTAIKELPRSIEKLARLRTLSLKDCKELTTLPRSICQLKSLRYVVLSGCSKLEVFPEIAGTEDMEKLRELHLDGTSIKEFLPSISALKKLVVLNLRECKELKSLPRSIEMVSLESLILSGCSKLENFPDVSLAMDRLTELNLDDAAIGKLPMSIQEFHQLNTLSLRGCREIRSLPSSIFLLKHLKEIAVSGCSKFEEFPEIMEGVHCGELVTLKIKDCGELKSLPKTFCLLKSLAFVTLSGCSKFEVFPEIFEDMESLIELHLDGTSIKELTSSIERLKRLVLLNLRNCSKLVFLPDNICNLADLRQLILSGCSNLRNLPKNFEKLQSMVEFAGEGSGIKQLSSIVAQCSFPKQYSTEGGGTKHPSSSSSSTNGLVGMERHIKKMQSLLCLIQANDVPIVGIWGVCGSGKTTIARAVYERIANEFEHHCFLEDVEKGFRKHGAVSMQEELLSRMMKEKVEIAGDSGKGVTKIKNRLGMRKVLLVLDDTAGITQIETLLGKPPTLFGGGSRIIVTTREEQVLNGYARYCPTLGDDEALELFRQHAFKTMIYSINYEGISRRAIRYAQGLPLALKVLGAFLSHKRNISVWEDELQSLKEHRSEGVNYLFERSFESLKDSEKGIFLDCACFFNGMKKDYATEILRSCGFFPNSGLEALIDRSLLAISERDGTLKMYDLIEAIGPAKSYEESRHGCGYRSRIWTRDGIVCLSQLYEATSSVEVINIDLTKEKSIWIKPQAFKSMTHLRLLQIRDESFETDKRCEQHMTDDFEFLSDELRCLIWHRYPLKSLPYNFQPKNLVDLDMSSSRLEQLWEGTKLLKNLKYINLRDCLDLKKISGLTEATKLEKLIVDGCLNLIEVQQSIWNHQNLVFFSLKGCKKLEILPSSIQMNSLKSLNLSGCSNLKKFPEISQVMTALSELDLDETAIDQLHSSIERLQGLRSLSMRKCRSLVSLPDSMCNLVYLQQLYLDGCSRLSEFPDNLMNKESLTISGREI